RRSHLSNERADLRIDRWTALGTTVRPPSPPAAKPVAMPAHDGVGLNEYQRRAPVAPGVRQGDPKESIARVQRDPLLDPFHRCQLLAQGHVLEDQLVMAAQHQREAADNHNEQLQHVTIVAGIEAQFQLGRVLAMVRPWQLTMARTIRWTPPLPLTVRCGKCILTV